MHVDGRYTENALYAQAARGLCSELTAKAKETIQNIMHRLRITYEGEAELMERLHSTLEEGAKRVIVSAQNINAQTTQSIRAELTQQTQVDPLER